ncbi:MAG: 1,6-anhydro-N-acetylmuramyl-L-alanine amidase AmpD [Burkholderiaceae bacterium]
MSTQHFFVDECGWCCNARRVPSPNWDTRGPGTVVDLLLIHNISLPPGKFGGPYIEDLFCNRLDYGSDPYFEQLRSLRVSAHFLVRRDGSLLQFVPTVARAWHAGASKFGGREGCNDFSIGIELEGTDEMPFEAAQYATLASLTLALRSRHGLTDVAGHEHVAPGRKTDPGAFFDWFKYRQLFLTQAVGMPRDRAFKSEGHASPIDDQADIALRFAATRPSA